MSIADARPDSSVTRTGSPRNRPPRKVWSIRWIATGLTVSLTVLAVLSVGAISDRNASAALDRELQSRTLLLARNLALTSSAALLGDFPELTLQPLVRRLLDQQQELAFAAVVDHAGRVQAHPDARQLGTRFAPALAPIPSASTSLADGEVLRGGASELLAEAPVRVPGGTRVIGRAYVGLRRDYIERTLAASRRQQLIVMLVFVAIGVGVAFLLMSGLLRPIATVRAGLQRIAGGDLESPIEVRDRTEIGLLADTVNEMAQAMRRARSELVERERLGRELELAREIQQSLLPSRPMTAGPFLVRGDQRPAAEVGGDYFDILPRRDGRLAIAIADVAGKGLAGCLVMAMLSALLRALRDRYDSPAELLVALDERLGESLRPGVFVTMFFGILDPATGRFVYASAGHNPLLVRRHGQAGIEVLPTRGVPLAAVRGGAIRRTLKDDELRLAAGDLALLYTDGFTEAFAAADREEFGLERVTRILEAAADDGGEAVLSRMREALQAWTGGAPPADDETLLTISIEPAGRSAAPAPGAVSAGVTTAAPVGSAALDPLEALRTAEAGGIGLELATTIEAPLTIRPWLSCIPGLRDLSGEEADWLASALYEACVNIAEHGHPAPAAATFHLWWSAAGGADPRDDGDPAARASRVLRNGCFVIRDDGVPYQPGNWRASDYGDPAVRRRGRGVGLDIIHHVMRVVAYHPATPRGNITLLAFGPRATETRKEAA